MTPTNKLRFVVRKVPTVGSHSTTIRVLQQWWEWEKEPDWTGEWRDVPLEVEE